MNKLKICDSEIRMFLTGFYASHDGFSSDCIGLEYEKFIDELKTLIISSCHEIKPIGDDGCDYPFKETLDKLIDVFKDVRNCQCSIQ